jgi:hypothetical protein
MAIDYAKAQRLFVKHKSALTRALHKQDATERRAAVLAECNAFVHEFDAAGFPWPDDWSRWQRALDDQYPVFNAPRLDDLR